MGTCRVPSHSTSSRDMHIPSSKSLPPLCHSCGSSTSTAFQRAAPFTKKLNSISHHHLNHMRKDQQPQPHAVKLFASEAQSMGVPLIAGLAGCGIGLGSFSLGMHGQDSKSSCVRRWTLLACLPPCVMCAAKC